jgi:hypothetical protein
MRVLFTVAVIVLAAQAQRTGAIAQPAPLYPYAVQAGQPYAVEVVPNSYVIQRLAASRAYRCVRCQNGCDRRASNPVFEPRRHQEARDRSPMPKSSFSSPTA